MRRRRRRRVPNPSGYRGDKTHRVFNSGSDQLLLPTHAQQEDWFQEEYGIELQNLRDPVPWATLILQTRQWTERGYELACGNRALHKMGKLWALQGKRHTSNTIRKISGNPHSPSPRGPVGPSMQLRAPHVLSAGATWLWECFRPRWLGRSNPVFEIILYACNYFFS